MKNIHISIFVLAAAMFIGCSDKAASNASSEDSQSATITEKHIDTLSTTVATGHTDIDTTDVAPPAPVTAKVRGEVTEIKQGKDGYTATIKDDSGKLYYATISKINMDTQMYKTVSVGDMLTVKGQSWKSGEDLHIKVEIMD